MHATRPHYPKPTMGELSQPAIDPCDRQRGCVGVSIFREDLCRGAADLLYQMMLFWESCRGAGQKVLCSRCRSFLASLKGIKIPGHRVASGADLPRTSTNSYSSHTSSRELFRCSRGPADTHNAIQHAHRSPIFKAAPHTVSRADIPPIPIPVRGPLRDVRATRSCCDQPRAPPRIPAYSSRLQPPQA